MKTVATVTTKGQLVVPVALRRKFGIRAGTRIHFEERGSAIVMRPVTTDAIRSLHGILKSKGSAVADLLRDRAEEKRRDDAELGRRLPR